MVEWIGKPTTGNGNKSGTPRIVYPYPGTNISEYREMNNIIPNGNKSFASNFRDSDRDGVPNLMDCQPNNPHKQGFIDAVIGGVKGLVSGGGAGAARTGWREGYAKKGNPVSRAISQRVDTRRANIAKQRAAVESKKRQEEIRQFATSPQEKVRQLLPGQNSSYSAYKNQERIKIAREAELDRQARARGEPLRRVAGKVAKDVKYNIGSLLNKPLEYMEKGNPNYASDSKIKYYKKRLKSGKLTPEQRSRTEYLLAKTTASRKKKVDTLVSRVAGVTFPVQSMTSYGSGSKTIQGIPGAGRGRPRGTLDKRYAAYGGVYGYRKYVSEQKRKLREQLKLQAQKQKEARIPQYERQVYTSQPTQVSQLPSELEGQQITPEYAQFLQEQQIQQQLAEQYSQSPTPQAQYQPPTQYSSQQYPTQPQQRPIGTVFKSSGGSPYQPVNSQPPLAPSVQTIPYGYVEATDLMTGRRYIKRLPQPEKWARGGGY